MKACWFHDWSKWESVGEVETRDNWHKLGIETVVKREKIYQRTCEKCGHPQTKRVKI